MCKKVQKLNIQRFLPQALQATGLQQRENFKNTYANFLLIFILSSIFTKFEISNKNNDNSCYFVEIQKNIKRIGT